MFLEQINRRLAAYKEALPTKKERAMPSTTMGKAPLPGTMKTIGVRVDAETYAALLKFKEGHGLATMREAAFEAIKLGVEVGGSAAVRDDAAHL